MGLFIHWAMLQLILYVYRWKELKYQITWSNADNIRSKRHLNTVTSPACFC